MANLFTSQRPHYHRLRKKWLTKHSSSVRQLTLGSLGGLMLLGIPSSIALPSQITALQSEGGIDKSTDNSALLAEALKEVVPSQVGKLSPDEEEKITQILSERLGILVKAEMEGVRLNRSYGLIGGEQHLYRYPGDNLYKHFDGASDWAKYFGAGMAPGLGAWGYFAPSESAFTPKDKLRERYYLAVQTFLSPGFAENVAKYRDFFKFRKMLVVNPINGRAVVAVVGDAGPSEWTGKHLGGSPEVMDILGLAQGPRKGPVLYFFIDDPQDQILLGPVRAKGGVS